MKYEDLKILIQRLRKFCRLHSLSSLTTEKLLKLLTWDMI